MTHVREQVVAAVVSRLAQHIPALQGRVYPYTALEWDRRTYPFAVVTGFSSRVSLEPGADGRVQERILSLTVEVQDLETEGYDPAARVSDLAVAVEAAMATLDEDVPVETVELTDDTGVTELAPEDENEQGVRAGTGLSFEVAFYTATGVADEFVTPRS